MGRLGFRRVALGLALLLIGPTLPGEPGSARGQQGGMLAPRFAPQGDWGRVVSVSPKWLIIENQAGQQFPIALAQENVGLFIVRWPTTPALLTGQSIVEVTGFEVGSNQIQANHLDVFEGDARGLLNGVWPSVTTIIGYGRIATPYNVERDNAYNGYSMVYSLPGEHLIPNRAHIVAPVLDVNPLRLATGRNNTIMVLPAGPSLFMTRVTLGSASYVQPGDLVYFLARNVTPKTLVLSQLVVYKSMPFEQFALP